jgi:hypothetical protein
LAAEAGSSVVGMAAIYLPPAGGAKGGARATSKRIRLDVGVLTSAFSWVFVIMGRSVKRLLAWSRWLRRWIDELPLRFEGMVRSVSLNDVPASSSGEPRDGVIHGFGFRSSAWSSPGGWIGGEVC